MADGDHSELVAQFSNITGVDGDRAQFYLESSAWNLDIAMASFYDNDGEDEPVVVPSGGQSSPSPDVSDPSPQAAPTKAPKSQAKSRFGTIGGMADSDSSSEEGQAFYAGGSEHSGQQVLGPPRKKKGNTNELVEDMFKAAKDHGAEEVAAGSSEERRPGPSFGGSGYRLGDTEAPSPLVRGGSSGLGRPQQVDMVLKLWKDGFSVDDGPLRDFQDPANKEFLDCIKGGEVPKELIQTAKGGEVSLNMEDHRHEDYVKPKVLIKAFSGAGHKLGSPAPTVAETAASSETDKKAAEGAAKESVSVDSSKPTTNIQIRLGDGSRLVAKFNHSHTVADVRRYIITARMQFSGSSFVLMTTFPNKELTDETVTLESANLLNAVLVQRMK